MRDKIRNNARRTLISVLALAIISYSYYETCEVFRGPIITVDSPKSGYSSKDNAVEILGRVKNVSYLYLNGRPIFADTSGKFKEKIILAEGYNSIFIEARDRIGKNKSSLLEIVFNKKDTGAAESLARKTDPLSNL